MKRRLLLSTVPAAVLAACTPTTTPTVSQLASDASLIDTGLSAVVTALQGVPGIPAATLTQLQGWLATIQKDATALASVASPAPASTTQEIISVVEELAPVALSFIPGGSALVAVVNAAEALLPVVGAAVGLAGATSKPPAYAPDQARLILRSAPALAAPK